MVPQTSLIKEQPEQSTEKSRPDDKQDLLSVREVAEILRVDDTTVRRWVQRGVLEAITFPYRGKRQTYRIRHSTLDALLNSSLPF